MYQGMYEREMHQRRDVRDQRCTRGRHVPGDEMYQKRDVPEGDVLVDEMYERMRCARPVSPEMHQIRRVPENAEIYQSKICTRGDTNTIA